jgi:3-methyladenine DNA glycosylase/8-oxoguanine DNA glycosylase
MRYTVEVLPAGSFDADWMRAFLAPRLVPALEVIVDGEYRRSLRVDGHPIVLRIRFDQDRSRPVVLASATPRMDPSVLEELIVDFFDLRADLEAFSRAIRRDVRFARLVRRHPGVRLPRYLDPFEGITRAILGQQVSLSAARTMVNRLVERYGARIDRDWRAFPTPKAVQDAGVRGVRSIGLTLAKARSVISVAEASLDGRLNWSRLAGEAPDRAQATLETLDGVGPWTAAYVRMRVLGDRDAFPSSDLGVMKAVATLFGQKSRVRPLQAAARAECWRPWRAYAALHLWTSLAPRLPRDEQLAGN